MDGHPVPELCDGMTCLFKDFGRKRSHFVPIFTVTGKWKHLTAQAHEFNSIPVIPADYFDDIPSICQSQRLDKSLSTSNIGRLTSIWTILGRMRQL